MLSQKARYALRALFVLGARQDKDPVMIADIAEQANVPRGKFAVLKPGQVFEI